MRTLVSDSISGAELRDRIPFAKELGIELLLGEDGRSKLQLEVLPEHLNGWGAVHGGVTMTALDVAMAVAARLPFPTHQDRMAAVRSFQRS